MNTSWRARWSALGLTSVTLAAACGSSAAPALPGAPTTLVALPPVPSQSARPEPASTPVAAPDYLADGVAATTSRRAMLLRRSPLRYVKGGETLGDTEPPTSLGGPKEVVVLSEDTSSVHILVEWPDLRLLLHAERGAFAQVPLKAIGLASAPDLAVDEGVGVRVAPGSFLVEKERRGSSVRVEGQAGKVTFEGWIAAEVLGVVFEPAPFEPTSGAGHVREGTAVLASPKGPTLATFGGYGGGQAKRPFSFIVEPEAGAPAGYQRIRFRTRQLELRGLVASVDYRANPKGGRLGGEHKSRPPKGIMSDSQRGVLPVGSSLYAPEDRSRVGRVLEPLPVYYGLGPPEPGGFVRVELFAGELGPISALARAADLKPEATP
ncbi:MAG: hypothetical protein IPM79_24195 [Polyangiaceae bacterium]|jgi:hypothetical protein|nr:hypothetical protein [Polyangiaceae bacterium]MBK8940629.1 hypothetical protein [Polyangiaceae bacterium]